MDIKGAIFDLDGLLIDTEGLLYLAWKRALEKFKVDFPENDYLSHVGFTALSIAEELVRKHALSTTPDIFLKTTNAYGEELLSKDIQCMPYAKEAVQYFISLGIPISIGTSSSKETAMSKLWHAGLLETFDNNIVTRDDVTHGKPAPDIYLKAAELLHANPEECLAFEDTSPGVQAAKAAGAICYAIPNRYTRGQDFSHADRVFPGLEEAIRYLEGCRPQEPLFASRWSSSL